MAKRQAIRALFFLLLLCSCHRTTSHWQLERVSAGTLKHSSARLTYISSDPVRGINLELLQTEETLNTYLSVHSVPLPQNVEGTLSIEGICYPLHAHRREGGQRLILSEATSERVIEALLEGKTVEITLPGYRTTIAPEDFQTKFEEMQNITKMRNPFHHPF